MLEQSFLGGLRTTKYLLKATWPFGGLTLSDEGMTVRFMGRVFTRRDWSGVASVERVVGGLMGTPGVRIRLVDGDQIVFWASPDPVLAVFRERGVHVDESEGRPPKAHSGALPEWIGWLGT
jgi:hypothetical protein